MTAAKLADKLTRARLVYTTSVEYGVLCFTTKTRMIGDYPVFFYHIKNHATAYAPLKGSSVYKMCTVAEGLRWANMVCQKVS